MSEARIACRGVSKHFRVPRERHGTLRSRLLRPGSSGGHDEFRALQDVDFEIHPGEFFGIVGRNGSGKSTLLKILAGIYRQDAGSVEVLGSVAPFIELGVGFNDDLSAMDNVFINGAILGMGRREIVERLPAIIEFAELQGFMEMKLRNYSSGMLMRLAFAIAVQADADILLVDEVLAVGDERFQRKCQNVFRERRRRGQTVVFVTHDMVAVESFCDRALVLDHGKVAAIGPTNEVVTVYHQLNRDDAGNEQVPDMVRVEPARATGSSILELRWARDDIPTIASDEPLEFRALYEIEDGYQDARLRILVYNEAGGVVGEFTVPSTYGEALALSVDNVFTRGRFRLVGEIHARRADTLVMLATDAIEVDIEGPVVAGSTRIRHRVESISDAPDSAAHLDADRSPT